MISAPEPGSGGRGPAAFRRTFRALGNPNYRLFYLGQIVSLTGTWMQSTALAWLVLQITQSPLALGTVTTVQFAPVLVFSLFGGVVADRLPKRRLLVTTQSVMACQALTLGILTATGLISLPVIYVLAALQGCANALDNPTRQAFVLEMVGRDELPNAVALNSSQFQLSRLVGPALGGLVIVSIGTAAGFFLNAASYLAVIAALLALRADRFHVADRPPRQPILRAIGEGVRYAVTTPDLAVVLLTMAVLGTFGYNFMVITPLLAEFVLHADAAGYGLLSSALAAGSLIAALGMAYSGRVTLRLLLTAATVFSVLLGLVGLSGWLPLTIALLFLTGVASNTYTSTASARLQLLTPPALRGRVMSLNTLLFLGSAPLGSLTVGFLAQHQGVQVTIVEMSIVCLIGVAAAIWYQGRVKGEG